MKRFDVLVVGGGPAGSTTALRLAQGGASVLLTEKAAFPRDKPCGGGLTLRAVHACPVDPTPVVEEVVDRVELRFRFGDFVCRSAREPVIWMTQRRRLDSFLLDAAREAGVDVREETRPELTAGSMTALVDGELYAADVVVGADGANGVTGKQFDLGNDIVHGVAYEGNADYETVSRARYARRAVIELADFPGGYGWVFPKAEHANVGVGAWEEEGPRIREYLAQVCEAHGIAVSDLEHLRGHRLPFRRPATRIASDRVLLVGDAAGLVDPASGDGMYECFVSSRLASEAILELLAGRSSALDGYPDAVTAELGALHRASWKLASALHRWPRLSWRLTRTALAWRAIERLLSGEILRPGEADPISQIPLRALSYLGRRPTRRTAPPERRARNAL
ncbi:MAG: geranylgeranyl reductase family protein [Gaiellaceae bacterium]